LQIDLELSIRNMFERLQTEAVYGRKARRLIADVLADL
jgi:hypothetical protein